MKGIYSTPEEKAQWPFQHTDEKQGGVSRGPVGDR